MLTNLDEIIQACIENHRPSQETLYREYYGFAMTVCLPYSNTDFEAEEIANDGFMKIFKKIGDYNPNYPFTAWIRRILINTAIDHFRSQKKHYYAMEIDQAAPMQDADETVLEKLAAEELMGMVRELPQAYRTSFLLYAVEGYKHHEIAKELGITEGTSKSNLAKAKKKLQQVIQSRTT